MAGASRTYFHCCSAEADPKLLLDPERQFTEPWGSHDHGRCDKCAGAGSALYKCRSCMETGPSPDCPACQGRVRFRETCPACLGDGQIEHTRRAGLAVFPAREGLYRYLAEKNANVRDKVVVELEGQISEERDLDADVGALLVMPEQIASVVPLDVELIEGIRERIQ
ncbi:MAG TPA: hypothetical protein VG816_01750 [Solirubrobacterales bacterium]|nr:hypothetical protein [Solirubrobacterales bacterium]